MTGWILENETYTLRLPTGSVKTIGRTARADFIITGALVSRLHCRVTADRSGQLVVEDLESTNGILVNGEAAERAVLRDGDKLTVGRVEFKVRELSTSN
jgi:pSer/pThr/pTyr-binding forkhead associated (FHA) protein